MRDDIYQPCTSGYLSMSKSLSSAILHDLSKEDLLVGTTAADNRLFRVEAALTTYVRDKR